MADSVIDRQHTEVVQYFYEPYPDMETKRLQRVLSIDGSRGIKVP